MTSRVRGTLARYGLAAGAVGAVSLLRLPLLDLNWPDAPYLLFAGAILVAAGFGGFGPGLLAVSLSVIAGNFALGATALLFKSRCEHEIRSFVASGRVMPITPPGSARGLFFLPSALTVQ